MADTDYAPPTAEEMARFSQAAPKAAQNDYAPPSAEELAAFEQNDPSWEAAAVRGLKSAGRSVGHAAGSVVNAVDSVFGGPVRAAVGRYADTGDFGEAVDAYKAKFGSPSAPAPTGKDLMMKAGLSGEGGLDTGMVTNPFASKDRTLKISPAGAAGTVADMATDPLTYVPIGSTMKLAGRGAVKGMELGTEGAAAVGRTVGPKVTRLFTGVPEKDFNYYRQNVQAADAAGKAPVEALKDSIDTGVSGAKADLDSLTSQREQLYSNLQSKMDAKKAELGQVSSVDQARKITASMEAQKAQLGDLSKQADQALASSNVQFEKQHLLDFIDSIGAKAGPDAIGDETTAALAKLKNTRQRIAEGMPDVIDGPRLRNVLQQLRRDIDFDQHAGEFNDTLNGMRKEFSAGVSNALKDQSPQYAAYMAKMADMSEALAHMRDYFGTESKALGSLESLRKGKNAQNQLIEEAMQRHGKASGNLEIPGMIDDFRGRQQQLAEMAAGDTSAKHFPIDKKAFDEGEANVKMAQDQYDGVKRLTPARSQSIAKRQGFAESSIEDRRALDNLQNVTGEPYSDQIQARHSYQSFDKDGTRGSANTNRFKAMGALVGGGFGLGTHGGLGMTAGAAAGAQVGAIVDRYGGQMARSAVRGGVNAMDSIQALQAALEAGEPLLGPWGRGLLKAQAAGGKMLLLQHHLLLNNDPQYRSLFEDQQQ